MLEFRAGKMLFEGKRVSPDSRKGLVRIARVHSVLNFIDIIILSFITFLMLVIYEQELSFLWNYDINVISGGGRTDAFSVD